MRRLIEATIVVVISSGTAVAQTPPPPPPPAAAPTPAFYRGRLVGVFDGESGEPVAGVEIRNVLNGLSALTSITGTLTLAFVDTGGGMLSIRKVGYEPLMLPVANSPHDTTGLTIVLKRVASLPAVVTNAKTVDSTPRYISPLLQEFEQRRHQGFGHFVSEADLRKSEGSRLSDVIPTHVPGVWKVPGRGAAVYLAAHRSGGSSSKTMDRGPCYVTIYLDGVVYYSMTIMGSTPPDLATMPVDAYGGIEFYAGGASLPVKYSKTDAGCGTLLLWSRER